MRNQHAYVAAAKFDSSDRAPHFLDGVALFVDYVFSTWPFRKIYLEVPSYNLSQLGSQVGGLLAEEGRLLDHVWLNGRTWDLHLLALYQSSWQARRQEFLARPVRANGQADVTLLDRATFCSRLANEFAVEVSVAGTAKLIDDLGFDSIECLRLCVYIESEYGVRLPEQLDYESVTIDDIWHYYEVQVSRLADA